MGRATEQPTTDDRQPPTVLHVRTMAGTGGGPEKTILRSPGHVDPDRYRIEAAYIHPKADPGIDPLRKQAAELGCPLHTVAERGAVDPRTVRELGDLCRRRNVRIWHGHDHKSDLLGLLLRRRFPSMKLITTAHQWIDDTWRLKLYRRVDEWCLRRYDRVVAVSGTVHRRCLDIGVPRDRLTLIPNAIETDRYRRKRDTDEAKRSFGIDPAKRTIGVVGRLSEEKGVDRLIRIMPKLRYRAPAFQLLIVGDGPRRAQLEQLTRDLKLYDCVRFCGWRSALQPVYEALDVLALPSRYEGLPNAVLEAMAMEVPVAATPVGEVPEVLNEGTCGMLFDDEDPADWVAPLANLLNERKLREQFAAKARARVEARYNCERRMQRMTALYDELLGRRAADRESSADEIREGQAAA